MFVDFKHQFQGCVAHFFSEFQSNYLAKDLALCQFLQSDMRFVGTYHHEIREKEKRKKHKVNFVIFSFSFGEEADKRTTLPE